MFTSMVIIDFALECSLNYVMSKTVRLISCFHVELVVSGRLAKGKTGLPSEPVPNIDIASNKY